MLKPNSPNNMSRASTLDFAPFQLLDQIQNHLNQFLSLLAEIKLVKRERVEIVVQTVSEAEKQAQEHSLLS